MKIYYKRLPLVIVLALLIFLPLAPSSGKVFWSRLLTKGASIFDPAGNWTQIYKCPMTINSARAFLSVYGCDDPLQSVTAKLKQSFSSNKEKSAVHNQISRLLMLAMPGKDQSVIFELIQSPEELSKPPVLPSESAVFGRSPPAESTLTTIIKNEETGATLETLMTSLPPERVCNELAEHLSRNGWKNISPAADNETSPRYFQIYQRKDALCTIMIGHAAARVGQATAEAGQATAEAGQATAEAGQALRENKTCVTILFKEKNGQ